MSLNMPRQLILVSLSVSALLVFGGCQQVGPNGPAATPIEGKILFTRGGDPITLNGCQGTIELQSIERPDVLAVGPIEEDGTFEVATLEDGVVREGAIEGTHRVRLNLDESAQHLVDPRFLNFETSGITVHVPEQNPLEVKVWR